MTPRPREGRGGGMGRGTKEKVAEGWRRMGRNNEGDTNGEETEGECGTKEK